MTIPPPLTPAELATALTTLPGWAHVGGKLHRTFEFADFVTAFAFMAGAALVAERMGHHPEWSNVYRTVRVELTTHDAGGLTTLDLELARAMSGLAAPRLS